MNIQIYIKFSYKLRYIYIYSILSFYVHIGVYVVCGYIVVVQLLSHVWFFVPPWTATCQAFLSWVCSLVSIELVMPSNYLILCSPLLPLPSILPSIRVFSSESALYIRRPKYWSLSFSISPFNEYSGLISFEIDWFDLLVVQGE